MTWLSVQVGLRGWRSQMPGLVFVTGAYFVTDMVGRGDFGEFVALAAIPFLIAAISTAFTTPTLRTRNVLAIVLGSFVLSGSHNITLLWSSVFFVLVGVVAVLAFRSSWRPPWPWPRVRAVLVGGVIGVGLNAWFLFPDLAYGLTTQGAKKSEGRLPSIAFTQLGYLLNPLRTARRPPLSRDIRVTTPWMFALWALVLGIALWRGRDRRSRTFFVGLFAITAVYLLLLFDQSAWRFLPRVLYNLQFTWRLHGYVLLATAGLVMVVLLWHRTAPPGIRKAATLVLVVLAAFSVGVATWQVWRVRPTALVGKRFQTVSDQYVDSVVAAKTVAPPSWYAPTQFRDLSRPIVAPASERRLNIPIASVAGDHFSGVLPVPDGPAPFRTNITAARPFLHFGGIKAVGRTPSGFIVAVRAPNAPATGPLRVTISAAHSPVIVGGELLSIASLLALLALLLWPLLRRLRAHTLDKRAAVAE
jgi:hypothetical protein